MDCGNRFTWFKILLLLSGHSFRLFRTGRGRGSGASSLRVSGRGTGVNAQRKHTLSPRRQFSVASVIRRMSCYKNHSYSLATIRRFSLLNLARLRGRVVLLCGEWYREGGFFVGPLLHDRLGVLMLSAAERAKQREALSRRMVALWARGITARRRIRLARGSAWDISCSDEYAWTFTEKACDWSERRCRHVGAWSSMTSSRDFPLHQLSSVVMAW